MAIQNDIIFLTPYQDNDPFVIDIRQTAYDKGMMVESMYIDDINMLVRNNAPKEWQIVDISEEFSVPLETVRAWFSLEPVYETMEEVTTEYHPARFVDEINGVYLQDQEYFLDLAKQYGFKPERILFSYGYEDEELRQWLRARPKRELSPFLGLSERVKKEEFIKEINSLDRDGLIFLADELRPVSQEEIENKARAYLFARATRKRIEIEPTIHVETWQRKIEMFDVSYEMCSIFTETDQWKRRRMLLGLLLIGKMTQAPTKRGSSYQTPEPGKQLTGLDGEEITEGRTERFKRRTPSIVAALDIASDYLDQDTDKPYIDQYWYEVELVEFQDEEGEYWYELDYYYYVNYGDD